MITITDNQGQTITIDTDLFELLKKEFGKGTKETFISVKSGVHVIPLFQEPIKKATAVTVAN
jgi:hypothetical protein